VIAWVTAVEVRTRLTICLLSLAAAWAGISGLAPGASAGTPRTFFGVVADLASKGDAARMKKAHVGSIRIGMYWPAIQPAHGGPYDWSAVDNAVALAAQKHISVLPVVLGTPSYEAPGCTSPKCPKRIQLANKGQRRDWTAFVRAAVQRYGRNGAFWKQNSSLPSMPIKRWQIWNEESNPAQHNSVGVYSKLVTLSDRAISSVDSHGKVMLGGMAGVTHGPKSSAAWNYLARLYKTGARKHIGAVALHPYSPTVSGIASQLKHIHNVLKSKHAASTPTYVTEIGWGSGGKKHGGTGSRGQAFVVTPKGQKKRLTSSFKLLLHNRKRWHIGGVYWYQWKDPQNPPPGLCAFCYSSGLYKANGTTAKPALSAYRRLASH
jgi:polysaccharide biosynthesis protein PslG